MKDIIIFTNTELRVRPNRGEHISCDTELTVPAGSRIKILWHDEVCVEFKYERRIGVCRKSQLKDINSVLEHVPTQPAAPNDDGTSDYDGAYSGSDFAYDFQRYPLIIETGCPLRWSPRENECYL